VRWIRLAPVTVESLVLCVALFASCQFQAMVDQTSLEAIQQDWGAIRQQQRLELHDGVRRIKDSGLAGPFSVWDGDWWRIPLTSFHHDDLLHLLLAGGISLFLGYHLEKHWGSFAMGLFLIPATLIPVLAELSVGQATNGFFGTASAMFGALVAIRLFDKSAAAMFSEETDVIGMVVLFMGGQATLTGLPFIVTAGQIAGFTYGLILGSLVSTDFHRFLLFRVSLILFHLWLIPSMLLVTNPFWIGRYHWYRAASMPYPKLAEKNLLRAVAWDPSLTGVWLRLSETAEAESDFLEAWRRTIRGLVQNPSNPPLMDLTRRLWRHLDARQRVEAEQILKDSFGRRAPLWLTSIRSSITHSLSNSIDDHSENPERADATGNSLDQKVDLPLWNPPAGAVPPLNPLDPDSPDDAAEGRAL
jgi:rhomboid protease GluP